ncbi:cytochrome P450 [Rhodovulum strictum]|uniref:Cytochrome P450 n=1 Tax=Rhodovulum strictum TaxID=58314 RepID=A0A844B9Q0_9RHOB|nr:cytochrome P450 [Rhodovulum strictum]MRH21134.1 cytochrome P450 [Rhodovulum strictum]
MTLPPKPVPRPDKVSLIGYMRRFRADILSAQPARLYRAWMAEFRTPFFRSFLVNQPDLLRLVLQERPRDFPKSERIRAGLAPLLGQSVFVTNGTVWERQRRIIDPAFEGGRLRDSFQAMVAAGEAAVGRLKPGIREIEAVTSHAAADVIFRTLFSIPIEDETAGAVFHAFRDYQRSQPLLNLAALVAGPGWMPRLHGRRTRATARQIRGLIEALTQARAAEIAAGTAPDDLATKIMTTRDPETGQGFDAAEMVDQVAIFFLAGHETSASALAWALYLLATHPESQDRVAAEAASLPERPEFADMRRLAFTRDVFREALRLYPPVPMMVREATRPERFRDRDVTPGAQIVISPWHLHRHERLWDRPDAFDPARFATPEGQTCLREAFIPFSAGPRVCTGAGFAMVEGVLLLALLLRRFRLAPVEGCIPVPVAHLTLRAKQGIWLDLRRR